MSHPKKKKWFSFKKLMPYIYKPIIIMRGGRCQGKGIRFIRKEVEK